MRFNRQGRERQPRQNWMSAMGILFIVMAAIIALRNLYLITTFYSFGVYLDNYVNARITNEKFVVAMLFVGGILLYWGHFKKKEDHSSPDEHEQHRFDYGI
jgi:undecaprenyl pyrophosphate phosphatase UppP